MERVEKQRRLMEKLLAHGLPAELALELLNEFERTLLDQRATLEAVENEALASVPIC